MSFVFAVACGDDDSTGSNNANNTSNNANNTANNTNNTTSNNTTNNTTNNSTNNTTNNSTNNATNNTNGNVAPACNPAFAEADACGGDPVGTWTIVDACDDYNVAATVQALCPTATVGEIEGTITGTLTVTATNWDYAASGTLSTTIMIPGVCAAQAQGCAGVQTLLGQIGTATCTGNASCECDVSVDIANGSTGTYTVSGGVATVDGAEEWYFCSEDGGMSLRRKVTTGNEEPNPTYTLVQN
jgi:hypothetical protein